MKKYASISLLSICLTVIAFTSVNSRQSGIPVYNITNIADTTPATHHKITTTKHHTATTSTTTSPATATHHTTTHHSTKTTLKDSTQKK